MTIPMPTPALNESNGARDSVAAAPLTGAASPNGRATSAIFPSSAVAGGRTNHSRYYAVRIGRASCPPDDAGGGGGRPRKKRKRCGGAAVAAPQSTVGIRSAIFLHQEDAQPFFGIGAAYDAFSTLEAAEAYLVAGEREEARKVAKLAEASLSGDDGTDAIPELGGAALSNAASSHLETATARERNGSKPNPKLLYIDAANYTGRHFFKAWQMWSLSAAEKEVKNFCRAGERSGFKMVAFIDQATMTEEAKRKWRTRREGEVRAGKRRVPQGALRLVGDMLAKHGVEVRYSLEADCDDTIAFHAQADGASVLSQDLDFLRYAGATYKIYKEFAIKGGRLNLVAQDKARTATSCREIGVPPKTARCDPFRDCIVDGTYLRGSPSPLVQLGNLHILVRPLRVALYHHLGIDSVAEEFPVRSGDGCVWDKQEVRPDDECAALLLSPANAVMRFEQTRPENVSDENWMKHQFALRSIVAEICCTANDSTLLETLLPLIDSMDIPSQKRNKKLKGQEKSTRTVSQTRKPETKTSGNIGDTLLPLIHSMDIPSQKRKKKKLKGQEKSNRTVSQMRKPEPKISGNTSADINSKAHYLEWRKSQNTGESKKEKRERYLKLFHDKGSS